VVILEKAADLGDDVARARRFFLTDTQHQFADVVQLVSGAVQLRYTRTDGSDGARMCLWEFGTDYASAVAGYSYRLRKCGFLTWEEEIR